MPDNHPSTCETDCGSPRELPGGLASGAIVQGGATAAARAKQQDLDSVIRRIKTLTAQVSGSAGHEEAPAAQPQRQPHTEARRVNDFLPVEPESFRGAGLTETMVESLVLKFLLARGDSSGREIADQVKLPFILIDELLRSLKSDQMVTLRGSAAMNDFQYQLSDLGRERARRYSAHCTYFGAAPVSLPDYVASVKAQTLAGQQPKAEHLAEAFADLLLSRQLLDRLGPAINSGRGLFLYGAPGNGKTSIAERVTGVFGQDIWIPRALGVDGDIIRVYDPSNHEELPVEPCHGVYEQRKIDRRWVRVRRPTLVTGGELTMSSLEVTVNTATGVCEAPLQLKSNCGTLVIDDFGRQRVKIHELLNRWILPLEKRYDFLNLPNGKKIEVPFDQLIIFSTNLEPRSLVDEAFLRRIPYKIEIPDPSEDEFRALFKMMAAKLGCTYHGEPIQRLIEKHYRQTGRPFRFCHPRDLLMQVRSFCAYKGLPLEITDEYLDQAVANYFAVM
ncbi:MAG: AAA family ATPase [Thermoguttaceae bacterium]